MKKSLTYLTTLFLLFSFLTSFTLQAQKNGFSLRSSYMIHNMHKEGVGWISEWPEPVIWSIPITFNFDKGSIKEGVDSYTGNYKIVKNIDKTFEGENTVYTFNCIEEANNVDKGGAECKIILTEVFSKAGVYIESQVYVSRRYLSFGKWLTYVTIYTGCE